MTDRRSRHNVVNDYFRLLCEGKPEQVVKLFASNAVVRPSPMPETGPVRGRDELIALYRGMLSKPVVFSSIRFHDTASTSVAEVEVDVGAGNPPAAIVDVFDIDDSGLLARMGVYKRS
ncbi:SnoaL-like domain-containing protein [Amycolatopsis sp. K13G38]|uniref:SnoaL-like domain-containing protein n=1 Tax=Amycolatopsis acididurans TaxID=2724524 RepID=A0ABX1J8Q7_9PSEU|nr:nuclear transport factor 2 family protein [Amycolatopsis acididurans]NKQ56093.1 SnoaL-like domain-containing protein [Amycolatopsis acididurans]